MQVKQFNGAFKGIHRVIEGHVGISKVPWFEGKSIASINRLGGGYYSEIYFQLHTDTSVKVGTFEVQWNSIHTF